MNNIRVSTDEAFKALAKAKRMSQSALIQTLIAAYRESAEVRKAVGEWHAAIGTGASSPPGPSGFTRWTP